MSTSKNLTAAATRPRRHLNARTGRKKGASAAKGSLRCNAVLNTSDSGFSSGSSSNTTMASTPGPAPSIDAASQAHERHSSIKPEESDDQEEIILPSIEVDDYEVDDYDTGSHSRSIKIEDSDDEEETILPSIEVDNYEVEAHRGNLKRKRGDDQIANDHEETGPQKKKSRGEPVTRGAKGIGRVTSGSVSEGYIKREDSDEMYTEVDEEETIEEMVYYEHSTDDEDEDEEVEDEKENVPPQTDYVDEDDLEDSYTLAALDFLKEQVGEAVAYFHKLVGPEFPAYHATVDLNIRRRRSWGFQKDGRPLVKLLAK